MPSVRWRNLKRVDSIILSRKEVVTTSKKNGEKDVIAYRKACSASGTGLSHYILLEKKTS
jgi:modified peptide precursor CbpA